VCGEECGCVDLLEELDLGVFGVGDWGNKFFRVEVNWRFVIVVFLVFYGGFVWGMMIVLLLVVDGVVVCSGSVRR
jgi:hypothetical protein